jgi:integrase
MMADSKTQTRATATGGKLSHTPDHQDCPACKAADLLLVQIDSDFSRRLFREAAELWMTIRRRDNSLKARTHETNTQYIEALGRFFGNMRLNDISPGHLKMYQDARANNLLIVAEKETHPWKRAAGHSIINHEISTLAQILKHCKLWDRLRPLYFPLTTPKWSPREEKILSEEDEQDLFEKAAKHPECALAYWVACITNNTSAAGCELRGLRLKHIHLRPGNDISEIYVPSDAVKNDARPRKIALNRTAKWAVEQCYGRALKLGSCQPDHYLFPLRLNREKTTDGAKHRDKYDPTRPASRWFIRKSWEKLRKVTGFTELNPHDLRHQCITRLLENGVEPETVRSIAGHVTQQMMEYYSHLRRRVKYEAVMAIELDEQRRRKQGPQAVRRYA